jgi:hypothetical protein
MIRRALLSLSAIALLGSCIHSQVSLDYQPRPAGSRSGGPLCAIGDVQDLRGMKPNVLGGVDPSRFGLGELITVKGAATDSVRGSFEHGLASRGMLAQERSPKVMLDVQIDEFLCRLTGKPYASAKVQVTARSAGGKVLYRAAYSASRQDSGYEREFGDAAFDLRNLASRALQDAVDQALDDERLHQQK